MVIAHPSLPHLCPTVQHWVTGCPQPASCLCSCPGHPGGVQGLERLVLPTTSPVCKSRGSEQALLKGRCEKGPWAGGWGQEAGKG